MKFLESPRDRAGLLILALGVAILIALTPFLSGLLGAAVLYVIFVGPYKRLARVMPNGLASAITLIIAVIVIALPLTWLISVLIDRVPDALKSLQSGLLLERLSRIHIGGVDLGAQIAEASGTLVQWVSAQAIGFLGGAASASLNLIIAFFGLYYMLHSGEALWKGFHGYVPFSSGTADALRLHFYSVTQATLLGTIATAIAQGTLIGLAFLMVGLPDPLVWGSMAAFASILPVLGTGLVWMPAVLVLFFQQRYGGMVVMLVVGWLVASNIDNLIRPLVYRKVSNIHPMVTLVGAFAGIKYFGLPGLLLGPLAIAYFFELMHFYQMEYGRAPAPGGIATPSPSMASE
ncbi:MAG TPA: AI-2E family transporter [Gemmatimonadaceae bacterium]